MEMIRRDSFGDVINAPFHGRDGRPRPNWELVKHVRDGDVILHWTSQRDGRRPGFIGWSTVDGSPYETDGLVYSDDKPAEGWEARLRDYTLFENFLSVDTLNRRVAEVLDVKAKVESRLSGPSYFPFVLHQAAGALRPHQGGYLTKFPVDLFTVLPELSAVVPTSDGLTSTPRTDAATLTRIDARQTREAGYISDVRVRKAIELRAVELAISHYISLGYDWADVTDVGATCPYDLVLAGSTRMGAERHIEVKGSTGDALSVELTMGEVRHAREYQPTDLIVVSGIQWGRVGGDVVASKGKVSVHGDWRPEDRDLAPTRFRYAVDRGSLVTRATGETPEGGQQA
jgi:hypothetical protein